MADPDYEIIPARRPAYPVLPKAMTDAELAAAREFVDTVATQDQSGIVFRHLCLLLGHAEAHGFTKEEAKFIIEAVESFELGNSYAGAQADSLAARIASRLRDAWL